MSMCIGWPRSDRIWSCLAPTPIDTVAVWELLRSWHDRHVIGEELLRSLEPACRVKNKDPQFLVEVGDLLVVGYKGSESVLEKNFDMKLLFFYGTV